MKPTSKQSKSDKLSSKQYEELGRIVASVYENGYLDAAKSYRTSFIKGILGGFGGVLGATILIALLLWFLSFFDQIPLINVVVQTINKY